MNDWIVHSTSRLSRLGSSRIGRYRWSCCYPSPSRSIPPRSLPRLYGFDDQRLRRNWSITLAQTPSTTSRNVKAFLSSRCQHVKQRCLEQRRDERRFDFRRRIRIFYSQRCQIVEGNQVDYSNSLRTWRSNWKMAQLSPLSRCNHCSAFQEDSSRLSSPFKLWIVLRQPWYSLQLSSRFRSFPSEDDESLRCKSLQKLSQRSSTHEWCTWSPSLCPLTSPQRRWQHSTWSSRRFTSESHRTIILFHTRTLSLFFLTNSAQARVVVIFLGRSRRKHFKTICSWQFVSR